MICKRCGCRVNDEAKFCDKCGASMAEFGKSEESKPSAIKTVFEENKRSVILIGTVLCIIILAVFIQWGKKQAEILEAREAQQKIEQLRQSADEHAQRAAELQREVDELEGYKSRLEALS